MISICTPVYNVVVVDLVKELIAQSIREKIEIEILVFDDGSNSHIKEKNRTIRQYANVNYKESVTNIGSAAIRNKMGKEAKYEHLLYIDSDSDIGDQYLKNYVAILNQHLISCGGRIHPEKLPSSEYSLRWKVGKIREDYDALQRSKFPNKSFMSNNFLVKRSFLNEIAFDEEIKKSGHEDTMMGIRMEEKEIFIHHIDNPVTHIGLETNDEFLVKTRQRLDTLAFIYQRDKNTALMRKRITLLKYFHIVKQLRFVQLIGILFDFTKKRMERNLVSIEPNMFLYDCYKIGYFSKIYKQSLVLT